MTKKLETLLKINTMMKQRAEQQFSELTAKRQALANKIDIAQAKILAAKNKLNDQNYKSTPQDFNQFEKWKTAQLREIKNLQMKDREIAECQKPLRDELASLMVKEKQFKMQIASAQNARNYKHEESVADQMQSLWINKNK